ncbi:MAG: hypothetical protein ACKVVT_12790 [Dehalococcoidia bacterium]
MACSLVATTPGELAAAVSVVVVGTVERADLDQGAVVRPEVFLKGPASSADFTFAPSASGCEPAPLQAGDRTIVFVSNPSRWPNVAEAIVFRRGEKVGDGWPEVTTEEALIASVRHVTGQYVVPVPAAGQGAGIDWWKTVVPVGVALAIIMGVSLFLMRIWHRIDPS